MSGETQNPPDGKTYPIRTLADIFALPSVDHIDRCLSEFRTLMMSARGTLDLLSAIAASKGADVAGFSMPETLDWTDDGKIGGAQFIADGQEFMSIRIEKEATP